MRHTKKEHCTCNGEGTCNSCVLFWCEVCNGAEGSLTTDCCGRKLTEKEENLVMTRQLDFIGGIWVKSENL